MATATASSATPSREDFAANARDPSPRAARREGAVVKGIVVGIEKDLAVIDVGR